MEDKDVKMAEELGEAMHEQALNPPEPFAPKSGSNGKGEEEAEPGAKTKAGEKPAEVS